MNDPWMFVAALAAAYMMPGPDMVLLLRMGVAQGRLHALAAAVGLAVARAVHVALAGLGLAAMLRTSPWAFDGVRFAGALYLVWMAAAVLRVPGPMPPGRTEPLARSARSCLAAARCGLLTNLLNPKALLFCSVLLPQFVRQEQGGLPGQFFLLGSVLVAVGLFFDALYAGAGTSLGRWAARHPAAGVAQRWLFAALLAGFGMRLLI